MAIYKEDIVDIELESGVIHRTFLHHSIGQGDAKANRFGVRLFRNGEPDNIGTATLTALFMAPTGQNQIINETNFSGSTTIDGNVAYVTLPSACYANEGQFCLAIKLNKSGVTTTMRIVDGMVANTGVTGAVVPSSTVPTSDQILAAYDAAVAMAQASVRFDTDQSLTSAQKLRARENIDAVGKGMITETEYDADATYSAGDYCTWNGQLRRSQVDGNIGHTPGESTTAYWAVCTAMGQVKTAIEDIAQPYDFTKSYAKGDYISRNRKILKANKTTGDGDFVSGDWDELDDIANDISGMVKRETQERIALQDDYIERTDNLHGIETILLTNGKYVKDNVSAGSTVDLTMIDGSSTNNCAVIDVEPGDLFTVNGLGGSAGRLWCFVDSSAKLLEVAAANLDGKNLLICAPTNADKLIINANGQYGLICKGTTQSFEKLHDQAAFPVSIWRNYGVKSSDGTTEPNTKRLTPTDLVDLRGQSITFYTLERYHFFLNAYNRDGTYAGTLGINGNLTVQSNQLKLLEEYTVSPEWAAQYLFRFGILHKYDSGEALEITTAESVNFCAKGTAIAKTIIEGTTDKDSYMNVKVRFGAAGDGTTNDATAIQNALNYCGTNGGGVLYFPPGTYKVNSPLIIYSGTKIVMDGGATILRGSGTVGIFYSHCEDSTLLYNGVHNIVIEGGTLDLGTGFTQGGVGIGLIHADGVVVRNVVFRHVNAGYHSMDICNSRNVRVENCIIEDLLTNSEYAECIQIDCATSNTSFRSPELSTNAATFDGTPTQNVEVCGCKFYLNEYSPAFGNHAIGENKRLFFHDNVIIGGSGSRGAIAFWHPSLLNATTEVMIHHNILEDCTYGFQIDPNSGGHIYVRDNIFKNIGTLKINPLAEAAEFLNNIELP